MRCWSWGSGNPICGRCIGEPGCGIRRREGRDGGRPVVSHALWEAMASARNENVGIPLGPRSPAGPPVGSAKARRQHADIHARGGAPQRWSGANTHTHAALQTPDIPVLLRPLAHELADLHLPVHRFIVACVAGHCQSAAHDWTRGAIGRPSTHPSANFLARAP